MELAWQQQAAALDPGKAQYLVYRSLGGLYSVHSQLYTQLFKNIQSLMFAKTDNVNCLVLSCVLTRLRPLQQVGKEKVGMDGKGSKMQLACA
jgi:hypothetical protein